MSEDEVWLTEEQIKYMLSISPADYGIFEMAERRRLRREKRDYLREWIESCVEEEE